MKTTERVMVIGGGVAGAAAAAELARAGRPVLLIERQNEPHHKVCGEFLSHEAALYLGDLRIDLDRLGAVRIEAVRLCAGTRVAEARLPFPAFSLSRRVLDEALLDAAAAAGADIRRGCTVRGLQPDGAAWTARFDDGETAQAAEIFLATGKHDVKGWRRPAGTQADLIAFKLHWRLSPAATADFAGTVELFLFPGGYAGLEPVEDGLANLCLVVRRGHFAAHGSWEALLAAIRAACPHLDRRLTDAEPCWERPLAVAGIPYGYVQHHDCGVWRLGDQAAVIPSFSGDGIAIALHSARLAARCHAGGGSAAAYQAQLARDVAVQVRRAAHVSRALVHPAVQVAAAVAAQVFPALITGIARATRIPRPSLRRAGLDVSASWRTAFS
jgi:flavin-dependent dehydrogenase